ncbi:cation diffusion facilitator family transporter [Synechococcus elongatus]|uniref:Cation diffusion facilitator family transporter n=2 Tax=Synechococcus elongatus TaxID=32046 RepID=Q31LQ0_SYNE7|nr:cation diffusion facilitator family transporter [Synechococcus elongatus]ABB58019.1 cation diffusion facilitator family transporter [Synechococcus elongatus PCC 7942 = FACHB-805]AJD57503.1 cation transporter [Synechococcus elongatus UTEX 2973]MBD2586736.1 cation transporter [Synechococcus elongatus FACHB-242]MBD2687808.1 cation transporter [Synechococcus elongatus FACHB-1061]MBD2706481.1 cation transporter [Synechococcus elongatus PCC 7942 = FACHB-805]
MAKNRHQQVRYVLLLTLALNLLVVVIKAGVGLFTGSLSLLADALHSVTDSVNNILGLLTNQLSAAEPDRDHPYGHHKYEAIGALGIAAFLGITCFEIIRGAIERLITPGDPITITSTDLWLLLIVLGVNIYVAFYERSVGKRLGSQILIADAYHTMSDIWITIVVLIGLLGIRFFNLQWLDIVLSLPVAVLVLRSSWIVLKSNLPWLVDEIAVAPEAIHQVVTSVPGVVNCHDIASRGLLGRQIFVDMHLIVDAPDVLTAHQITEAVEARLAERYAPIRVTIHVEPPNYQSTQITYGSDTQNA